jgi:hypothetical protein
MPVTAVEVWVLDRLVYAVGSSAILDLYEPPTGSTSFASVTIGGGEECVLAGTYTVKGSVLAKIAPERKFTQTGEVKFATVKGEGKAQEPSEYEEKEKSGTKKTAALKFDEKPAFFESTDSVELASKLDWGAF